MKICIINILFVSKKRLFILLYEFLSSTLAIYVLFNIDPSTKDGHQHSNKNINGSIFKIFVELFSLLWLFRHKTKYLLHFLQANKVIEQIIKIVCNSSHKDPINSTYIIQGCFHILTEFPLKKDVNIYLHLSYDLDLLHIYGFSKHISIF